jgi:hypothetical protein
MLILSFALSMVFPVTRTVVLRFVARSPGMRAEVSAESMHHVTGKANQMSESCYDDSADDSNEKLKKNPK